MVNNHISTTMKTKVKSTSLTIRNVHVTAKNKDILRGVNAAANSGDLLAIMGPTGSGKTTLLNAIAGRVEISSGNITLNGQTFNKQLRRRLGYVLQEDVFMSRLTLYETLYFTAMIRIPEHVSKKEKCKRIQDIIDALDLNKCKHTVFGDIFVRGLSGGEKKRANIACELLTNPDIMLLDEPTSGLDSSTAHSIMMQLRNYATHSHKTIIATIHQPSSQVYHMFCSLLLLMDGQVAYFGNASSALDYFEKLGLPCAIHFNPADFLLGLMKSDVETCQKILTEAKNNGHFKDAVEIKPVKNGITSHSSNNSIHTLDADNTVIGMFKGDSEVNFFNVCKAEVGDDGNSSSTVLRWPTSFWTQYCMLTWRQFKQSKGHILHKYEVVQAVIMALVTGTLYFQTEFTYRSLRDKMGVVFFCVTYWGFNCIINSVTSFPAERGVIMKERQSGAYRLSALYCAKMTSDVPLVIILPVVFLSIIFWMSSMGNGVLFVIFIAVIILHCFTAQSIGHILGAGIYNMHLCIIVGNTFMLFSLLLSGFFNTSLPVWLQWAKYFSLVHYCFATFNILSTDGMPHLWCNTTSVELFPGCAGNTTFLTKDDVLRGFGIDAPYFCYIATLGILLVVLRIIGYYVLRYKR